MLLSLLLFVSGFILAVVGLGAGFMLARTDFDSRIRSLEGQWQNTYEQLRRAAGRATKLEALEDAKPVAPSARVETRILPSAEEQRAALLRRRVG